MICAEYEEVIFNLLHSFQRDDLKFQRLRRGLHPLNSLTRTALSRRLGPESIPRSVPCLNTNIGNSRTKIELRP